VHLSVWSENLDAQRFYRRHGFDRVADVAFPVGDHVDIDHLFALRI
jgi:hypothetical protein